MNVLVRETRLEVAVDGLPLYGGAQLAVDAIIVSPRGRDCNQGAAEVDGVALTAARRRKERRCLGASSSTTGGSWD